MEEMYTLGTSKRLWSVAIKAVMTMEVEIGTTERLIVFNII